MLLKKVAYSQIDLIKLITSLVLYEKNKEEIIKATNGRFSGEFVMLKELLSK